ncbi:hypothetical protein C8R45DRAFT_935016 [Mycena sanguinolenta]|nr:hypothetical protein C8R45DRAFT_935016 [Mycena sanguinolenta]
MSFEPVTDTNIRTQGGLEALLHRPRPAMMTTWTNGEVNEWYRQRVARIMEEAERAHAEGRFRDFMQHGEIVEAAEANGEEGFDNPAGAHVCCAVALTAEELYIGAARPATLTTDQRIHQSCVICREVKSHPVMYLTYCFEQSWRCPECWHSMARNPIRAPAEQEGIEYDFPQRVDGTEVTYSWEGLTFPGAVQWELC